MNDSQPQVESGSEAPPALLAGRYQLDGLIATGGMATVHAGHDVVLHRRVAIKILRAEVVQSAEAMERLRREACTVARLQSPHVVTVYDFGELADQGTFIVMELLVGLTLRQRLQEHSLSAHEAVLVARQILSAVVVAHGARVLHLDLTPSNLIITTASSGEPHCKVVDFGISRTLDDRGRAGEARPVFGTRNYMAPEVRRGRPADVRADVYSVGVILYEMISGAVPPAAGVNEAQLPPSIPGSLRPLLCKALRADPDDRWQNAAAMSAALADAHALVPLETRGPTLASEHAQGLYRPTSEVCTAVVPDDPGPWAVTTSVAHRRPLPAWESIAAAIVLTAASGALLERPHPTKDAGQAAGQRLSSIPVEAAPASAVQVSLAPAPDPRTVLANALDDWIDATNAKDLERQRQFYPRVMDAFYLWRRVPLAAVMAEKQRVFSTADVIDIRIGSPEIRFNADGSEATMQFRKRYVIRGPHLRREGEVMQQLRWAHGRDGWRIVSERDLRVIA